MHQEREGLWSLLRRGLLRLLPPATPQPEDRESVWSVSRRDARTFFRLLSLLWLVGLAYIAYRTPYQPATAGSGLPPVPWWQVAGDYIVATLGEFGPVAVGIAIIAMLLTRPLNITGELLMSLYQAMVNRYVIPVIERHKAEGRAEGRTQGRAEGKAERDAEWLQWLRRREDAEAQGLPFDEPPPAGWPDDSEIC